VTAAFALVSRADSAIVRWPFKRARTRCGSGPVGITLGSAILRGLPTFGGDRTLSVRRSIHW
jgi:hypothetical protein